MDIGGTLGRAARGRGGQLVDVPARRGRGLRALGRRAVRRPQHRGHVGAEVRPARAMRPTRCSKVRHVDDGGGPSRSKVCSSAGPAGRRTRPRHVIGETGDARAAEAAGVAFAPAHPTASARHRALGGGGGADVATERTADRRYTSAPSGMPTPSAGGGDYERGRPIRRRTPAPESRYSARDESQTTCAERDGRPTRRRAWPLAHRGVRTRPDPGPENGPAMPPTRAAGAGVGLRTSAGTARPARGHPRGQLASWMLRRRTPAAAVLGADLPRPIVWSCACAIRTSGRGAGRGLGVGWGTLLTLEIGTGGLHDDREPSAGLRAADERNPDPD